MYDLREANKVEMSLKGHEDVVRQVRISKQGLVCLSGSADGTVRMWDLRYQQPVARYDFHATSAVRLVLPFHHFTKLLITCAY